MKVAVSSRGDKLESVLDPRFGRAPYLVIYDTEADELEVIDNTSAAQLAHGAGVKTAQSVVDKHADLVVSGSFGPKACQVLRSADIRLAVSPEVSVSQVLEMARNNSLRPFEE